MKRLILIINLILILGCREDNFLRGISAASNRDKLQNVKIGMTQEEVKQIMGKPRLTQCYENYEIWSYITEWQPDGFTTEDEMTPLVFLDGKLEGWGPKFRDQVVNKYEIRIR